MAGCRLSTAEPSASAPSSCQLRVGQQSVLEWRSWQCLAFARLLNRAQPPARTQAARRLAHLERSGGSQAPSPTTVSPARRGSGSGFFPPARPQSAPLRTCEIDLDLQRLRGDAIAAVGLDIRKEQLGLAENGPPQQYGQGERIPAGASRPVARLAAAPRTPSKLGSVFGMLEQWLAVFPSRLTPV